jgi:virginiamycin A acetyltransferase
MIKRILLKIAASINLKKIVSDQNQVGKSVKVGQKAMIRGSSIHEEVTIGPNCRIAYSDLRGMIEVGKNTSIWGPNVFIRAELNPITIGNFCSIARNVTIQEYNHNAANFTTYFLEQNMLEGKSVSSDLTSKGPIVIEHDVWIGANATILSGSFLSTGSIIGAGSVVNGFIPPYAIAVGSPAKVVKYRFDASVITKLLATEWWKWDDEKLKASSSELEILVGYKKL